MGAGLLVDTMVVMTPTARYPRADVNLLVHGDRFPGGKACEHGNLGR